MKGGKNMSFWKKIFGSNEEITMTTTNIMKPVYYLLPLQWSLYYYMTTSEWRKFREYVKTVNPQWEKCDCPKGCKANSLDEKWQYNHENHIKRFITAKYICPGCHWLKTPPWRIDLWLRIEQGIVPDITEDGHIIRCLGWNIEKVKLLRERDMLEHRKEIEEKTRIESEVKSGKADIAYWKIDLSLLKGYGYTDSEISEFTRRMNNLEQKRISKKEAG